MRSTYGFILGIGCGPISFKSRRAPTVSLSYCEAEYVAACVAAQEVQFLRAVLGDLGFPQLEPTTIFEDNQSCIAHCRNNYNHTRMKHIDVKKYYVRELVQDKIIHHHIYISTDEMVADLFTKPLPERTFKKLCSLAGVVSL